MPGSQASKLDTLLDQIRRCNLCADALPHQPRPVLRARSSARILVVGQAPGTRVHATGIPWNDASGRRLRQWLGISEEQFYDESRIAIVPMGFCYPGKGRSGDLPPRPECARTWHQPVLELLPEIRTTLLIGQYSQQHYLAGNYRSLTERVQDWRRFAPGQFVLPHPSPRNQLWLRRNSWFENEVVPALQQRVSQLLQPSAPSSPRHE
ncbi:MAG: uracil-DNA glycosylase family protein [Gammaproteobacteria bacterium]|nr:uracil-DNA glycosylase family protein [Pseudomonadales bacterium]MCP5346578.1 uracil-DNA glycosylase family protein [Pseudomonadales bacterium]